MCNDLTFYLQAEAAATEPADAAAKLPISLSQQLHSLFKKLKGSADDFYTKLHTLENCIIEVEGNSTTLYAEVELYPCTEKGRTVQVRCIKQPMGL